MRVNEIIKTADAKLIKGSTDTNIDSFSIDSRIIKKGDLFIAIKGNRFDSHDFIEEAFVKGAKGTIISNHLITRTLDHLPLIIEVNDTIKALGDIAHYHRMQSKANIIMITGSNGKTTTKDMITSVLRRKSKVLSAKGTENNNIGLPLTLLRLKDEEFVVLEAGMNHYGEIDYLTKIARPQIGIMTNIGPCHLEGVGGIEDVFKAKIELLKYMNEGKTLIINGDDPYLSKINKPSLRIIKFGFEKHNDIRATSVELKEARCDFRLNNSYNIQLNLLGRHNVYNALAAVAVAELFGLDIEVIQDALKEFKPNHGRLELKKINGIRVIDDTYNSNPVSLRCAIETLAEYKVTGKKILVSGDMLELGNMSQQFHKAIAGMVKTAGIDILVTVGKYSHKTYLAAKENGMKEDALWYFEKPREAGQLLKQIINNGDLVLVKGSRNMMMEEVITCFTTYSIH